LLLNGINFRVQSKKTELQFAWSLTSKNIRLYMFLLVKLHANWGSVFCDCNLIWIPFYSKVSGEIRKGSPDSELAETVKKLNDAENLVKTLRQELRSKNEGDNFSRIETQMKQSIDNDLLCNICYEMFIKVILIIEIVKNLIKFLLLLIFIWYLNYIGKYSFMLKLKCVIFI